MCESVNVLTLKTAPLLLAFYIRTLTHPHAHLLLTSRRCITAGATGDLGPNMYWLLTQLPL